jgi:signal transduction histidine kinase
MSLHPPPEEKQAVLDEAAVGQEHPEGLLYQASIVPAMGRLVPNALHGLLGLEDSPVSSNWWLKVEESDAREAVAQLEALLCGQAEALDLNYRVQLPGGQVRWLRDRVQVSERTPEGLPTAVIGMLEDVTGRRVQIHRSQEIRDRYRSLFDSIEAGFCVIEMIFDVQGVATDYLFREVNAAFEKNTGITQAQGRRMRDIAPDHEAMWFSTYGEIARSGAPCRFEHSARQLGFHYDVYAFPVGDVAPYQVGILFTDITGRKQAEVALAEENRRKTEFIAMLAHELRNPLATVTSGLQVMSLADCVIGRGKQVVPMVERQLRQTTRLLDDLLDVNRISLGKLVPRKIEVDLVALVREAIEAFQSPFELAGKPLAFTPLVTRCDVWADPMRLHQVIDNLVRNAMQFTGADGEVQVTLAMEGSDAVLCVSDNGVGIEAVHLDSIFELFAQVDAARQTSRGGLGVGMALARQLVELHDGSVHAYSDGLGKGARFVVRLPALHMQ